MDTIKISIIESDIALREKYTAIAKSIGERETAEVLVKHYISVSDMRLDIDEPGFLAMTNVAVLSMDGSKKAVELAYDIRKRGYMGVIIFTAPEFYPQFFEDYFNVGALHYIIKDDAHETLLETQLARAIELTRKSHESYLVYSCGGEAVQIATSDICYYEVQGKIVTVYYGDNDSFSFVSTMQKVENELIGLDFIRTHKSFIVNLAKIRIFTSNEIVVTTGERVLVGRKYYQDAKEAFKSFSKNSKSSEK